jgi:hypothetical protein
MVANSELSAASEHDNIFEMHFIKGGAPPHFALPVRALLESHFTGWWIGRGGQTEWPYFT